MSIKQDNCSKDDDDHIDSTNEAIVIAENCVGKVIHSNTEEVNVSVKTSDIANTSSGTTTESVYTGETFEKKNIDKGVVYATVVLQNSPFSRIENVSMVGEIIGCKDHLKRNIIDIKFGKSRSWFENVGYTHEIPAVLLVDTRSLWESSRTYIWRHLGNDSWSLKDGTMVSFSQIHHK